METTVPYFTVHLIFLIKITFVAICSKEKTFDPRWCPMWYCIISEKRKWEIGRSLYCGNHHNKGFFNVAKTEEHQKEENRRYEKYQRDPNTRRRYGRAWKRIRDSYVKTHPFCELCYEKGVLVEVEEVHHKIPLAEGGTHDRSNLISLCKSCHAKIHAERGDRWHGRRSDSYEWQS